MLIRNQHSNRSIVLRAGSLGLFSRKDQAGRWAELLTTKIRHGPARWLGGNRVHTAAPRGIGAERRSRRRRRAAHQFGLPPKRQPRSNPRRSARSVSVRIALAVLYIDWQTGPRVPLVRCGEWWRAAGISARVMGGRGGTAGEWRLRSSKRTAAFLRTASNRPPRPLETGSGGPVGPDAPGGPERVGRGVLTADLRGAFRGAYDRPARQIVNPAAKIVLAGYWSAP